MPGVTMRTRGHDLHKGSRFAPGAAAAHDGSAHAAPAEPSAGAGGTQASGPPLPRSPLPSQLAAQDTDVRASSTRLGMRRAPGRLGPLLNTLVPS